MIQAMLKELHDRRTRRNSWGYHPAKANEVDGLSTYAYNALLSCWSHLSKIHPRGPLEAEKVMRVMTRHVEQFEQQLGARFGTTVAPDAMSYILVMRAWANSQTSQSASRVQWLLQKQWKDYEFELSQQREHDASANKARLQNPHHLLRP